jgi:NAD(P) transhydrogenase subunit alpha
MIAAVIQETFPNEKRVALIPRDVASLKKAGLDVVVEAGAGAACLHSDADYEQAGARIESSRERLLAEAGMVLMVRGPGAHRDFPASDLDKLKPGAALIGFLEPLAAPEAVQNLAERKLTALSMELMPRITRAQSMDALSSMANIAGYKAVLMAAGASTKMFPMMMTAAGTVTPARVFVLGAGVAGLQAIATAKRLGAVVEAYDVRPEVKEQVESLGGRFVELDLKAEAEGKGGYAAAQSEDFYRRQREQLAKRMSTADVVITTALVPGRKAPVLITKEMAEHLAPGAVIIDLAAEKGGNCALTEPGQTVEYRGIKIIGPVNLPSEVAFHASQMYSKNVSTFVAHLVKDGKLNLNLEDEIVKGTLVAHEGRVVHEAVLKALEPQGG